MEHTWLDTSNSSSFRLLGFVLPPLIIKRVTIKRGGSGIHSFPETASRHQFCMRSILDRPPAAIEPVRSLKHTAWSQCWSHFTVPTPYAPPDRVFLLSALPS